jgi:1-phosphatidylinositol-4-phosphate 5-kinase
MCAYFLSTKSNDSSDSQDAAQVLRQLVAFLIASKGYLDYVIWFAVNSIERRQNNGASRLQESADVDVDLSPQVNSALRSEILYYTTSGIKESVDAVTDELIAIPISGDSKVYV